MQTELHVDDSAIQNWDIFYGTLLMYTDIKDLFLNFKLFGYIFLTNQRENLGPVRAPNVSRAKPNSN